MKVLGCRVLLVLAFFFVLISTLRAQDYIYSVGSPRFTTAEPVELGFVNLANGNLHLEIPLASPPQRGKLSTAQKLVYDSRIWMIFNNTWQPNNVPVSQGGWRFVTAVDGSVSKRTIHARCDTQNPTFYDVFVSWAWTSPDGTKRSFPIRTTRDPLGCEGVDTPAQDALASDSSGYHMYVTNYTNATVFAPDGTQVFPVWKDTNGNMITKDGSGNLVDTLGRVPVLKTLNGSQTFYDVLNSQGMRSRVTVNTGSIPVSTGFGQPGVGEFSGSLTVITSIVLPDSTNYQFGYDTHGELASITLPTGGQTTYGYTNFQDSYGTKNRWVTSRTSGGGMWSYTPQVDTTCAFGAQNCQQSVNVQKPSGDLTILQFRLNNGAWKTTAHSYGAGSTFLQTVISDYDFNNPCPPDGCTGAQYIRTVRETVTVGVPAGGISRKNELTYDAPNTGNIVSIKEWSFTTGTFGPNPDRQTDIAYVGGAYLAKDMRNLPTSITLKDGALTPLAQTLIDYDTTALISITGVSQHDDPNFGTGNTVRGNPTRVRSWVSGSGCTPNTPSCLTTINIYDTTGQLRQTQDPKLNPATTFSYGDSFYNDANPPVGSSAPTPTNAYLTQVTSPLIGSATFSYYFGTGQLAVTADPNGAQSENHYLDSFSRPTLTYGPTVSGGRAWALTNYTSPTQLNTYTTLNDATATMSCTSCRQDRLTTDSLGRNIQTKVASDSHANGPTTVDTTYDSSGRVASVSNPHRSGVEPTDGVETPTYDGLNRVTQISHADGQLFRTFYGSTVTANGGIGARLCSGGTPAYPNLTVDEAGKKRQTWRDGFGRVVEVDEPDSSGVLTLSTCYSYNLQDKLLQVAQGSQSRTYTYDNLGRVITEKIPESGNPQMQTSYFYTDAGGNLCSGDPGAICARTDPRGITTNYIYDALNRLVSKDYSNTAGPPDISYFYDQTSYNGLTITNGKGRRTGMSDGSGQTAWSYDAAGNPLTVRKTINGSGAVTKAVSYAYNLNGSVASITYPSGRVVTYAYNNTLMPIWAVDTANAVNYVLNAQYTPHQVLASALLGNDHGNGGTTLTQSFNNRLQPVQFRAASATRTLFDVSFGFNLGGGVNNGSVAQVLNNRDHIRDQTFTYDELNRLKTATAGSLWGNQFVYDRYGNLLQKILTAGTGESLTLSVDANTNRIVGYTYDAAGNLTNDSINTYTYNAENKMMTANNGTSTVTFTYDGDGVRVMKSGYRLYWAGTGSEVLAETFTSGGNKREYIYFAGKRVAMVDLSVSGNNCLGTPPDCARYYFYGDHLGSGNVLASTGGGTTVSEYDFYPFGGKRVITSSTIDPHYDFTGKEWDSEDSLNHFLFREYSPRLARFMTADLLAGEIEDPQSFNRYSYTENDPINSVDRLGLCREIVGGFGQSEDTPGGQALIALGQEMGANVVFPYERQGLLGSLWDLFRQGLGLPTAGSGAASRGLRASDASSDVVSMTWSAGAQAQVSAMRITGITPIGIDYVSPGVSLGGSYLRNGGDFTSIFRGRGFLEGVLGATSPAMPGQTALSHPCGHDVICALGSIGDKVRNDLARVPRCGDNRIYGRKGSKRIPWGNMKLSLALAMHSAWGQIISGGWNPGPGYLLLWSVTTIQTIGPVNNSGNLPK